MIRYPYALGLERRVKRLRISGDGFLGILKSMDGRRRVRTDGIPRDARTVGIALDDQFNTVSLYLESAEFDEVPEGEFAPELHIYWTEYRGDAWPATETTDAAPAR